MNQPTQTIQRVAIGAAQSAGGSANLPASKPGKVTMQDIAQLPKAKQFPKMLEAFKSEIGLALPKHLNPDRMARIALTCFRQTPKLAQCDPASVFSCVVVASQLGLEPGLMGEAYLIPFKNNAKGGVQECQLIPGYQGLVKLARNSGRIQSLTAHAVYERDSFRCVFGLNPELTHEPNFTVANRGAITMAYAVAHFTDGGSHATVMPIQEIYGIRDRSENYKSAKRFGKKTPWDTDEEQMCVKTVLRRICKMLPKSVELASALAMDALAANGRPQQIDLSDIIEGETVDLSGYAPDDFDDDEHLEPGPEPGVVSAQAAPSAAQSIADTAAPSATPPRGSSQDIII